MYIKDTEKYRIDQGDIFQNFRFVRWMEKEDGEPITDFITLPFFIILTQSCDLEQDYKDRSKKSHEKRDKYIHSVLVCPAYIAESFKRGEHLKEDEFEMEIYDSKRWKIIKQNSHPRFHYLFGNSKVGLPDMVVDFKHYYTIPTYALYKYFQKHYIARLNKLFREELSHRFSFYLSRIGLPTVILE